MSDAGPLDVAAVDPRPRPEGHLCLLSASSSGTLCAQQGIGNDGAGKGQGGGGHPLNLTLDVVHSGLALGRVLLSMHTSIIKRSEARRQREARVQGRAHVHINQKATAAPAPHTGSAKRRANPNPPDLPKSQGLARASCLMRTARWEGAGRERGGSGEGAGREQGGSGEGAGRKRVCVVQAIVREGLGWRERDCHRRNCDALLAESTLGT
jgi:hypothetical protein